MSTRSCSVDGHPRAEHRVQITLPRQLQLDVTHRLAFQPRDQVGAMSLFVLEEALLVKHPRPIRERAAELSSSPGRAGRTSNPGEPSVTSRV
jgi:hypothetical protein